MSTPIDKEIERAVRCVKCGARYGECECWNKLTANERKQVAKAVTEAATYHLRSMYPKAYAAIPKSAWRSLRGCITNALSSELQNLETNWKQP